MSSGRQTEHIADKHGLSLLPKDMIDYERANEILICCLHSERRQLLYTDFCNGLIIYEIP